MKKFLAIAASALVGVVVSTAAQAIIVTGAITGGSALTAGGTFIELTPPLSNPYGTTNSVGDNNFQDPNLYGFNEDQNILITAADVPNVIVNIGTSPVAGDIVASHYIFFDPAGSTKVIGWVEFDADVFGIMTSTTRLNNSDFLANTGVNYLSPTLRGLESVDSVSIDGSNAKRIYIDFTASSPGDYIRVLTKKSPGAVPEPATLAIFGLGLAGLGLLRRRRKG